MNSTQQHLATPSKRSIADFELIRRIGDGSYSHVVLARQKTTGEEVALKVVDKKYVVRHNVINYIRSERALLASLNYEGFITLKYTFQDVYSLYMALEYCPNGELYDQIRLKGRLSEHDTQFYAAEIVLMLEELRKVHIVHRDLKPENLLLDLQGHLKLIDFGSAKKLEPEETTMDAADNDADDDHADRTTPLSSSPSSPPLSPEVVSPVISPTSSQKHHQQQHPLSNNKQTSSSSSPLSPSSSCQRREVSLVGTADYVSPEILNNEKVTYAADLWALGCVMYQMLVGRAPFKAMSEYLTFQLIVAGEWSFPPSNKKKTTQDEDEDSDGTDKNNNSKDNNNGGDKHRAAHEYGAIPLSEEGKDLVTQLLQLEPRERLGAKDIQDLKNHPFFCGIDWDRIRTLPAPEMIMDEVDSLGSGGTGGGSSFDWELQSLSAALPSISQMKGSGNELMVGSFDDEAPRRGRGYREDGSDDEYDDVLGVIEDDDDDE